MSKKTMVKGFAAALSGVMMLGMGSVALAAQYPDVNPGDWYYEYVQDVSDKGLMSGYTDTGKFGPNDKLTRGQFATILWRMEGSPEAAYKGQFPDVAGSEFYGSAVAWASENGIITGYTDSGKFGPNDNINREQMATILYRYDGSPEVDLSSYAGFPDAGNVNGFAQNGMAYAVSNQILTGDKGNLVPQGTVVRAVCATMISRFDQAQNGDGNNGGQNPDGEGGSTETPTPEFNIQEWADRNGFEQVSEVQYQKTIDGILYSCNYGYDIMDPDKVSKWYISVDNGKAASGSVVIPESIDGINTTFISNNAFGDNATITDITIPATVTRIGEYAFNNVEITTYIFQGDAPYGFNGINPMPKHFTVKYPSGAAGWENFTFVSDYFEPEFIAY